MGQKTDLIIKRIYRVLSITIFVFIIMLFIIPYPGLIEKQVNNYAQQNDLETKQFENGSIVPEPFNLKFFGIYQVEFDCRAGSSNNIVEVKIFYPHFMKVVHILILVVIFVSNYLFLSLDLSDKRNRLFEIFSTPLGLFYLTHKYILLVLGRKTGILIHPVSYIYTNNYIMQYVYEKPIFYDSPYFTFIIIFLLINILAKILSILVTMSNNTTSILSLFRLKNEGEVNVSKDRVPFLIASLIFSFLSAFSIPLVSLSLAWVFTGSSIDQPSISDEEARKKQLDRFKGLISLYGEISIDEAIETMEMEENEFKKFLAENVGSGVLKLTLKDGKIIPAEEAELADVLDTLEIAFTKWYEQEDKGKGKKK